MLFNSLAFLIFFPLVTAGYFLTPPRYRWIVLLAASCYFYMYFIPYYILILLGTIAVDYLAGLFIERSQGPRRKLALTLSLVANISCLALFKYFNFFIGNLNEFAKLVGYEEAWSTWSIILPIGLSFHTFQAMSYTIEVYRGHQAAERHFGIFALYVLFYPQLVAGPIERPQNMLHQFHEIHHFSVANMVSGLRLMAYGMFMKVVIADRLAPFVARVYAVPEDHSGLVVAVAAMAFSVQIFCDFAGYSLIAIGSARTMGFHLMKNFDRPYHAQSISEFWRRWHISLSTWFRDYLYVPLGGNRVSKWKWRRNVMIVFLLSGLWHGASWSFVAWGGLHGLLILLEEATQSFREKTRQLLGMKEDSAIVILWRTTTVFCAVTFCWIFFRAESFTHAIRIIRRIFSFSFSDLVVPLGKTLKGMDFSIFEQKVAVLAILVVAFVHWVERWRGAEFSADCFPWWCRWPAYYGLLAALCWLGVYGKEQFIYFQF